MAWIDVIWSDANEEHVERHGLNTDEVEHVIRNPAGAGISRTSGRPHVVGYVGDRNVLVVYEEIDAAVVYPVTAYELAD